MEKYFAFFKCSFRIFSIIFYFLLITPESGSYYKGPDLIDYLLTFFFPYLLAIFFGIKYIFTPLISLFEEKGFFASLWASRKRIDSKRKFNFAFFLILFSILSSFIFRTIGHFYSSFTFLISFSYLSNTIFLIVFSYFVFKNYEKLKGEKKDFSSKLKKLPTFVAFLVGIPLLLIFLYFFFAISFLDYDPSFSDLKSEELEIEITKPKRDGNLYYFLKEAGFVSPGYENSFAYRDFKDPDRLETDSYAQFIKNNPEEAKKISEANREALDYILEAADKNHYNSPISFGEGEKVFTENGLMTGAMFKLSRINTFEIIRLAEEEKDEEALKRLFAGLKLANLIADQESGPRFIDLLISIAVKGIHHRGYRNINLSNISDQYLSEVIEKMDRLEIPKSVFNRAVKVEYMVAASLIDNPKEIIKIGELKNSYAEELLSTPSYFYKPNETKRNFFVIYDRAINNSNKKLSLSGEALIYFDNFYLTPELEYECPFIIRLASSLPQPIGEYLIKSVSGNWIGTLLNDTFLLTISPNRQYEQLQNSKTYHRLQKLNFAIELYRREHNGLPDNLEQLSPDYISQIPEDPFNQDNALKYSKEEGKIYSTEIENYEDQSNEVLFINLN